MEVQEQINTFIAGLAEPKRSEMKQLHQLALRVAPGCKLWFLDGKDRKGKVVTNPNIGYGSYTINYADGTGKAFYRVGFSPNATGISVYIMGLNDKEFLKRTYARTLGKATVTGYCIKFKKLEDVAVHILEEIIRYRLENEKGP